MSTHRPEKRSGGLESEDLDLLFPSPDTEPPSSMPAGTPTRDYKKAAAGEHDEVQNLSDEEVRPQNPELEPTAPTFEGELWPTECDMPEPDLDEEIDLDPGRERRHAVAELGKATSRAMIDEAADPKPRPLERVHGERQPSDRTWREEIYWILQGRRGK